MASEKKAPEVEHEFYPVIDGVTVPLHGYAEKVNADGSREGRMQFSMGSANGQIDGVEFDVYAGIDCSLCVIFKRPGDTSAHTYYVQAPDVVRAAFEADNARSKGDAK